MTDTPNQTNQESVRFSSGQALRAAREAQGLTLEYIAEKLKLSVRQLVALESDDFQSLPGNTFVRGFVRNYARLVGIDPQPLLEHLSAELPQERVQVAMPRVGDATALNTMLRIKTDGHPVLSGVMVVLGLLLGAGGVVWYLQKPVTPEVAVSDTTPAVELPPPVSTALATQEQTSEPDSVPVLMTTASESATASAVKAVDSSVQRASMLASASAPRVASIPVTLKSSAVAVSRQASAIAVARIASVPAVLKASAVQASRIAASKPAAVVASAAQSGMIRVTAEFDSWVQIVDAEGHVLVSQLLTSGAERFVSGQPPFRVKIGNAPKTRLYYRGKAIELAPYAKADVATLELK